MGTLKILLQHASNLDTLDIYEQRPFCIMEYGSQKVRSKPCTTNGKDPVWDTAYKFQVTDAPPSMTVIIKDEASKKLLGTATLDLTIGLKRGKDEATVPVYTPDKFQQGTLTVKIRYSTETELKKTSSKKERPSTASSFQTQPSKRGTRDQSKSIGHANDDVDYMNPELEATPSPSLSERPHSADPSNPFLSKQGSTTQLSTKTSWSSLSLGLSQKLSKSNSQAEITKQPSGDGAVVEDLIEMNKKLNQEMKSLKVAFGDQEELLKARNSELEELHAMLDRYASEKSNLEAELDKAKHGNGHAVAGQEYGLSAFRKLEGEKADFQGKVALAERERQQAEDDLQDTQARYEKLLEEVNQLQLNLKNTTAELQQARSQERFLLEEKEQLQSALRGFENNNQNSFQKVVGQLEEAQRALSVATTEKQKLSRELGEVQSSLDAAKTQTEEQDYLQQQLRKAWSTNLDLQNRIRQLEAAAATEQKPLQAAAPSSSDNGKQSAALAAELLSENEFLKKQLIATKLDLAEAKESQVVAQRNLLRATSSKRL